MLAYENSLLSGCGVLTVHVLCFAFCCYGVTMLNIAGLESDGSLASHPLSINRPVRKLSEIDNWFDAVSYSKGGAVLRMLRAWLNRNNNAATGLTANANAPSSASGDKGKEASTSQQWEPHLRKLQGSDDDSSSVDSSQIRADSSGHLAAAGTPRVHPASGPHSHNSSTAGIRHRRKHHPGDGVWVWHSYSKDRSSHPAIHAEPHRQAPHSLPSKAPAAAAPAPAAAVPAAPAAADVSSIRYEELVVLPVDAPVPPAAAPTAVSVGSRAGWLAQRQMQQGPGRVLGSSPEAPADTFLSGLHEYLEAHAYSNSNFTGLWHSLAEASGEPVGLMMSTWTLRR